MEILTDICVYGDSPGGVTAALSAAREGAQVVLVSPDGYPGGILRNGLGSSDLDNHNFTNSVALGGMAREFFSRIGRYYGEAGLKFCYEPKATGAVFEEWLAEFGVQVCREFQLREHSGVVVENGHITSLRSVDDRTIRAKGFVDGTVEGDLMTHAGVSFTWEREGNAKYGETLNGIRTENTYRQFTLQVDPYVVPGDPLSGTVVGVQDEPLGEEGEGDDSVMGFCFRICLTREESNRLPITQPEGYRGENYELYRRYFTAGGAESFFFPSANLPNQKCDLGSWHDLSANLYGLNHGFPNGSYADRELIFEDHKRFTLGLIWFLQNDPDVPDLVRERWLSWGLPKDEFEQADHWPRQLYVRSARRMISDTIVTQADLTAGAPQTDQPVAVAFWPPDLHHARRIPLNGYAYNEGFVFQDNLGDTSWQPFGVPYGAMTPKSAEVRNLLVPIALSSSYVAYGAIRLEWTFMSLGEAAGTAAALAVRDGVSVQDVSYHDLADRLRKHGAVLTLPPQL